jgi:ankyrin repeat protein
MADADADADAVVAGGGGCADAASPTAGGGDLNYNNSSDKDDDGGSIRGDSSGKGEIEKSEEEKSASCGAGTGSEAADLETQSQDGGGVVVLQSATAPQQLMQQAQQPQEQEQTQEQMQQQPQPQPQPQPQLQQEKMQQEQMQQEQAHGRRSEHERAMADTTADDLAVAAIDGAAAGGTGTLSLADAIKQKLPLEELRDIVLARPHDLEAPGEWAEYPFHLAIRMGSPPDVIAFLAEQSAPSLRRRAYQVGWLPLHVAARYAKLEVVRAIAELDPDALMMTSTNGDNLPLHLVNGNPDEVRVFRFLANRWPDALHVGDKEKYLPAHVAAASMSLAVVQYAFEGRHSYAGAILKRNGMGRLPLHVAAADRAKNGDEDPTDVIRYLAKKCPGALLDGDHEGCLPIHLAAKFSTLPAVEALVDLSPDKALEVKTTVGNLPLHLGASNERDSEARVVAFLVARYRTALWTQSKNGFLPIHSAAYNHTNAAAVRLLAQEYPKGLQQWCNGGFLPLHRAILEGAPVEVVRILVEACPKTILLADRSGNSALHHAAGNSATSTDVFRCLFDNCPGGRLVNLLAEDWNPTLQDHAEQYFVDVTQDQAESLVERGAIRHLVRLYFSPNAMHRSRAGRSLARGALASARFQRVFEEAKQAWTLEAQQKRSNDSSAAGAAPPGVAVAQQRPVESSTDDTGSSPQGIHDEKELGKAPRALGQGTSTNLPLPPPLHRNDKVRLISVHGVLARSLAKRSPRSCSCSPPPFFMDLDTRQPCSIGRRRRRRRQRRRRPEGGAIDPRDGHPRERARDGNGRVGGACQ